MTPAQQDFTAFFLRQQQQALAQRSTSYAERVALLNRLEKALEKYRGSIYAALMTDLHKSETESDLTELLPVFKEIHFVKKHLRDWMSPFRVPTPAALTGSASYYRYEPKGVCLIISPWNYPLNLTLGPLVAALAAGNTAMIKPSERSPACTAVISELIADTFDPGLAAVFPGDGSVGSALLDLPFDHIFFTGSAATGKKILEKAARHLSPATLELGGKSPTIIDDTANLKLAARRIAWSKMINYGQTCIAPDYLLVHTRVKDELMERLKTEVDAFYKQEDPAVCRLIDEAHHKKMQGFLEGLPPQVQRLPLTSHSVSGQVMPQLIVDPPPEAAIMQEEIFGPLLPLLSFESLQEAIAFVQARPKPLSLYLYSGNRKNIRQVMEQTSSGGVVVNMGLLHFINPNLPFGGIHASGMGKGHGFFGFQAFSHAKSVLTQDLPLGAAELFSPPYSKWKQRLLKFVIKYV